MATFPRLFRICSTWYNTREEYLALIAATMSGPSFTANTDMNLNKHLWIQRIIHKLRLTNPTNSPIHVEIFKIQLKCDDAGATPGVYLEPTLPFATGSAYANANAPSAPYWEFFDQSSRQPITASGASSAANWTNDTILSLNTGGIYSAPVGGNSNSQEWERADTGANGMRWERADLNFMFPKLRRKATVRRIFRKTIPAYTTKQTTIKETYPPELRPRDIIADSKTNFSRHSYFLFISARSVGPIVRQTRVQDAAADRTSYQSPQYETPAQLIAYESRKYEVRRSGDSFPTFGRAFSESTAWLNTPTGIKEFGTATILTADKISKRRYAEQEAPSTAGGLYDTTTGTAAAQQYPTN